MNVSQSSKLLRGTFILSSAVFITKFLGLIFFVPLKAIVGTQGVALYLYAYTPYTIILSLATLGIPMAVSKFVSKYNALGDYYTGRRLLKSGFLLMFITGFIAFLVLYLLAPEIAPLVVKNDSLKGNKPEDVIMVIRLVSIALIIVPAMSLMRGFFQGYQSMGPTAVSQVLEQFIRILFALIGAATIIFMFGNKFIPTAVGFATFAPVVGALGGLATLFWYWSKRKKHLNSQLHQSYIDSHLSLPSIYKELITFAVPFVAVGLAIPLYQLIDQLTVNNTLTTYGVRQDQAEKIYANISGLSQKLIMIPVSLATALSQTLIPTITNSFSSENYQQMKNQITQAFQTVLFLTIPAVVGLSILAYPIYGALYGMDDIEIGGKILRWYAPTALLFSSFMISSSVLQGINRQKFAVLSLLIGLFFKLLLNTPLLAEFHEVGAILATDIGFICSITLNLIVIRVYGQYKFDIIPKRMTPILLCSIFMALIIWGITTPFKIENTLPDSQTQAIVITAIGILVGVSCYFWMTQYFNITKQIFGYRFSFSKLLKKIAN